LPIFKNEELLRLLYTSEEIPQVVESLREYVKKMKSRYSSEIFQAILDLDLNRAKKAVQQEGIEMLTEETTPPSLTPFELADLVCFTAFFDWLSEKSLIPDFSFQTSFFAGWYFMEADSASAGIFRLLPRALRVITLRYHMMQDKNGGLK